MRLVTAKIFSGLFLIVFATMPVYATSYTFTQLPIAAGGLNDLGQIVGFVSSASQYNGLPAVYEDGTVTSLGFAPVQGTPPFGAITPIAINDNGLIAAGYFGGTHVLTSATFQLGSTILNVVSFVIHGENNRGEFVGFGLTGTGFGPSGILGFVPSLGFPNPTGINDLDQVVGSFLPLGNSDQGFLLSKGVYTTLVVPGALKTDPVAVNNIGEIVGTFIDATGEHGFEDENGLFSTIVGPNGGTFLPLGLNNLGQIIGTSAPLGQGGVSYLASPQSVPEQSTLALMCGGLLGLLGWRTWARRGVARPVRPPAIR